MIVRVTDGQFVGYDLQRRLLTRAGKHLGPITGSYRGQSVFSGVGAARESLLHGQDRWAAAVADREQPDYGFHFWESLTPQELDRVKRSVKVDPARLAELRTKPVFPYQMDDHVTYFLVTGDVELGRNLAKTATELLQQAVDGFVKQDQLRNQGSSPDHRTGTIMWSAILGDLALSPGVLTPPEGDPRAT